MTQTPDPSLPTDDQVREQRLQLLQEVLVDIVPKQSARRAAEKLDNRIFESQSIAISRREDFRGPLPHPSHFLSYEQSCPGAADRIITMAEKQQAHRHQLEISGQANSFERQKLGLILAGVLLVCIIIGVVVCAYLDQKILGGALIGTGVLSVLTKIISDRRSGDVKDGSHEGRPHDNA